MLLLEHEVSKTFTALAGWREEKELESDSDDDDAGDSSCTRPRPNIIALPTCRKRVSEGHQR